MPRSSGVILIGLVCAALVTASLEAQESLSGERVLHRYLDASKWYEYQQREGSDGEAGGPASSAQRPRPAPGEPPGLWLSPAGGEWILTADGPVGPGEIAAPHGGLTPGQSETELDERTDHVDDLDYQANFEPSVVPFKRGVAQNRVRQSGNSYSALLNSSSYRPVSVGGALAEGEERFWGTFLVRFEPGGRHAIPSVAPDQRVLSAQTEPPVELTITRDEADNFYLAGDHRGLVRVNLELAVARHYFDGALEPSVRWEDLSTDFGLDDFDLLKRTEEVLDMIGVDRETMSPLQALNRMVEYHREFEMRPGHEIGSGDRYLEISRQGVGVCRHRSLVFMISAQALGIPTRYVYNEAHAFVEVNWPGQGWRRIDLGGAADTFNYSGPGGGQIHDGMWDDEFPRPDSYEEEVRGMVGGDGEGDGGGQDFFDDSPWDDQDLEALEGVDEALSGDPAQLQELLSEAQSQPAAQVHIIEADGEVFRGRTLRVRGRVDRGSEVGQVEVFLVPSGSESFESGVPLGQTPVGADGRFIGEWTVPRQVSLGRWRLVGRPADDE